MKKTFRYIFLTKGQVALVDWEDFDRMACLKWRAQLRSDGKGFYAATEQNNRGLLMHRFLLALSGKNVVDHANHDSLDNRRTNLRVTTQARNCANSRPSKSRKYSKYKGVSRWHEGNGSWFAQLVVNRKHAGLGRFDTEEQAARAYDEAAKQYFGEFACLNFP